MPETVRCTCCAGYVFPTAPILATLLQLGAERFVEKDKWFHVRRLHRQMTDANCIPTGQHTAVLEWLWTLYPDYQPTSTDTVLLGAKSAKSCIAAFFSVSFPTSLYVCLTTLVAAMDSRYTCTYRTIDWTHLIETIGHLSVLEFLSVLKHHYHHIATSLSSGIREWDAFVQSFESFCVRQKFIRV